MTLGFDRVKWQGKTAVDHLGSFYPGHKIVRLAWMGLDRRFGALSNAVVKRSEVSVNL